MNRHHVFGSLLVGALLSPLATAGSNPQGCPPPVNRCDPGCYDAGNKVTGAVAAPAGLRRQPRPGPL